MKLGVGGVWASASGVDYLRRPIRGVFPPKVMNPTTKRGPPPNQNQPEVLLNPGLTLLGETYLVDTAETRPRLLISDHLHFLPQRTALRDQRRNVE